MKGPGINGSYVKGFAGDEALDSCCQAELLTRPTLNGLLCLLFELPRNIPSSLQLKKPGGEEDQALSAIVQTEWWARGSPFCPPELQDKREHPHEKG